MSASVTLYPTMNMQLERWPFTSYASGFNKATVNIITHTLSNVHRCGYNTQLKVRARHWREWAMKEKQNQRQIHIATPLFKISQPNTDLQHCLLLVFAESVPHGLCPDLGEIVLHPLSYEPLLNPSHSTQAHICWEGPVGPTCHIPSSSKNGLFGIAQL